MARSRQDHIGSVLSSVRPSITTNGHRLRVALLSFDFGEYCIRLANGLSRSSDVLLLLRQAHSAPYRFGLDPDVNMVEVETPRLRQPAAQVRMVASVLRRLEQFDPDVIHLQAGHPWFNLVWPFYRSRRLVVTVHETRHHLGDRDGKKFPQWMMNLGYRRADRIIVHGEQLRRDAIADLGTPNEIIDVVPAVPDIVLGHRDPGRAVEGDGRSILFFGRIWEYKGLEYLIRAEPLISRRAPHVRIVIAGRGEEFAKYRAMMTNPDRFEVHNEYIPDSKLIELFRRAEVVALPYIDGSISGVVPVACTFGKPIVATSVGILPEMVEHGRTGLIVPPRDSRALGEAIVDILTKPELKRTLAAGARERAVTMFDPASVGEQTIDVYRRALNGGHP
jgi:glycosyltransferase involved in cell wall biosynthesis